MTKSWPKVLLVDVLKPITRPVKPAPGSLYRQIGVKLWGVGAYEREPIDGINTKYSTLYRVETDDIIVNKIWARNGSVAVVQAELAECFVSGEFPTFIVKPEKLLPRWIHWLTKTPSFWTQCDVKSRGTSGKNRIRPEQFLQIEIPLPPPSEQRRVVARIEELAAKIEEAKEMRRQAMEKAEALLQSALYHIFAIKSNAWKRIPMTQAIAINDKQVDPTLPDYSLLPHISGENIVSKTCKLLPYRTAEGDNIKSNNYLFSPNTILYSKIRPYLRKAVFVDFQGVCSADIYPIKVINDALVPKFVMWSLIADPFTEYANRLSGRTRMPKLNRKQLFGFTLSYPDKREQSRIVNHLESLRTKTESLEIIQEETAEELEAFLPSVLDRAFKGEL